MFHLLRTIPLFAVALLLFPPIAPAQPLPDELTHLTQLEGSEEKLVEAVRRLHLQQKALLEWDQELLKTYLASNQQILVDAKREDVNRRIGLIERAWTFVLDRYPNNAKSRNYYGEVLYDYRGNILEAVRQWHLAINLDEKLSAAHNNLGLHYFHIGDLDSGLRHLGKAIDLEPRNPDYLFNLAQIYFIYFPDLERRYKMPRAKLYKEAMRLSADAIKYGPGDYSLLKDYANNFYTAENFGVQADWEDAAEAWRRARTIAPDQEEVFFTLLNEGRVWVRAEQWENAEKALAQAIEIMPDSRVAQELLNRAHNRSNENTQE